MEGKKYFVRYWREIGKRATLQADGKYKVKYALYYIQESDKEY